MSRQLKVMIACGVAIVLLAGGLRQAFGVFLNPVTLELDLSRQFFGLVIASQALLFGLFQPAAGLLADRYGAFRIMLAGALLYAAGLWWAGQSTTAAGFFVSFSGSTAIACCYSTSSFSSRQRGRFSSRQHGRVDPRSTGRAARPVLARSASHRGQHRRHVQRSGSSRRPMAQRPTRLRRRVIKEHDTEFGLIDPGGSALPGR